MDLRYHDGTTTPQFLFNRLIVGVVCLSLPAFLPAQESNPVNRAIDFIKREPARSGSEKSEQSRDDGTRDWVAQGEQVDLKAYNAGEHPDVLATFLKRTYATRTDVQIVLDKRTSRILVNAPVSEQEKIAAVIRNFRPPAQPEIRTEIQPPPVRNEQIAQRQSRPGVFEEQFQLRALSWQDLLKHVQGMTQQRLALRQLQDSTDLEVTVTSQKGPATFQLNPKNGLVKIIGQQPIVQNWIKTIQTLDGSPNNKDQNSRLVPLREATPASVTRTVFLLQAAMKNQEGDPNLRRAGGPQDLQDVNQQEAVDDVDEGDNSVAVEGGFIGQIQVEFVEGLDALIIKGRPQDIERMMKVIEELERVSAITVPEIKIVDMKHVSSEAMAELVTQLNLEVLSPRQGTVSITPLIKPNSLLLIGRPDAVKETIELIERLDQPVEPESQFKIYRLRHMPAETASATIQNFFIDRGGLGPRIQIQSDFRTNSIIVFASPRDMKEVRYLLDEIDVDKSDTYDEVQVFQLKNASALELAQLLQQTLRGDTSAQTGAGGTQQGAQQQQRPGAPPIQANQGAASISPAGQAGQGVQAGQGAATGARSSMLQFKLLDAQQQEVLQSGILTNVRVSADTRTNSLVITAPKESMPLIAALVEQLDRLPSAESQIDVFTINNGSAVLLFNTLTQLFGNGQQQQGGLQTGLSDFVGGEESSLVPLRFSVDERSNSIIATGSTADLLVVESVLTRLDSSDTTKRQYQVIRLLNAPAQDVEASILNFLTQERQVTQPTAISQYIEREVVIASELVSNSLIISATPRYFDRIIALIKELDARPPMVMVQVLIAEISLDNTEEIGFEMGIQDSLLFDRSVAGVPGFDFNNRALGNGTDANALRTREKAAGQALSSFALGRSNSELGYGGLVLSASSESISVLVRALQETGRLDILSRPQIMTLNNQPASVLVGAQVPLIGSTTLNNVGSQNSVERVDVGLLLGVTPRISPDGLVVMEIDATRSSLGSIDDGIPVAVDATGGVVRQPIINTTQAITTVSARSGQTIILGGLITKDRSIRTRRVPFLSDVPVLGQLFRFDSEILNRSELLFILTPYIVNKDEDVDWINQVESQRMSWCLADVAEIHGETGMTSRSGPFGASTQVIYPDQTPLHHDSIEPFTPGESGPLFQPREIESPTSVVPTPANSSSSIASDLETGDSEFSVAKWNSVQERQFTNNDEIEEIKLNPPEPRRVDKKKDQDSGFSSIWSKLRGRKVESNDGSSNQKANFLSPVSFTKRGK